VGIPWPKKEEPDRKKFREKLHGFEEAINFPSRIGQIHHITVFGLSFSLFW
jgi:hypothetical protein